MNKTSKNLAKIGHALFKGFVNKNNKFIGPMNSLIKSKEAEERIKSLGGEIGSGVSKKTTHLVMKAVGSGSSKEKKAQEFGCEIMTLNELMDMLP